jgi:hypothetical protein
MYPVINTPAACMWQVLRLKRVQLIMLTAQYSLCALGQKEKEPWTHPGLTIIRRPDYTALNWMDAQRVNF